MSDHPLFRGIACALGAGLCWGLVFVVPVMLGDYPPAILSFGRYLAFGAIALLLALRDRQRLAALDRADWGRALELALVGNLLYYLALAAAIQLAGAPLPTMIIGTLPIVIAVVSNLGRDGVAWRRLLPPLLVIGAGIALVNQHELAHMPARPAAGTSFDDHAAGIVLAIAAVACWTWYPIRNASWLQARPRLASGTWATAQGLATLPLALAGYAAAGVAGLEGFAYPFGPRPLAFIGLMLAVGLFASWIGTLLWNRASQLLPTALTGQLIVFETLAALAYAFLWRGQAPGAVALAGIGLLVAGVLLGVRVFQRRGGNSG